MSFSQTGRVHQKNMNFQTMDDNHKPRMLKDFLNEKISSNPFCSSSNNNGFKSLPRKPITRPSMRTLMETGLKSNPNYSNPGIWCKTGFSRSAFQTLLNAVKAVSFFNAVKKSPHANENKSTVKMKDFMRWKLCRDPMAAVASEETPSTAAVVAASCSTSGWSESDLSSWECDFEDARNDVVADFEFSLFCFSPLLGDGEDYVAAATGMAKVENKQAFIYQEQQQSPISVLHVGEDEFSPSDQSLANNQRKNQTFMQHIKKIESLEEYDDDDEEEEDWVEKSAMEMLHYIKSSTCSMKSTKANLDKVLLDIFKEELNARRNQTSNNNDCNFELDLLKLAEDWINREHDNNTNKDTYVKDMDWRRKFGNYEEEEQEELALEIETNIFYDLVGEVMGLDC